MEENLYQLLLWARGTHLRFDEVLLRNIEEVLSLGSVALPKEELQRRFKLRLAVNGHDRTTSTPTRVI